MIGNLTKICRSYWQRIYVSRGRGEVLDGEYAVSEGKKVLKVQEEGCGPIASLLDTEALMLCSHWNEYDDSSEDELLSNSEDG